MNEHGHILLRDPVARLSGARARGAEAANQDMSENSHILQRDPVEQSRGKRA